MSKMSETLKNYVHKVSAKTAKKSRRDMIADSMKDM